MKLVPSAVRQPHIMVGFRTMADNQAGNPVVDTEQDSDGFHLYVSYGAARECARLLGYVAPDDYARTVGALEEQLQSAYSEIESLKANLSVPLAEVFDFATEKARIELARAEAEKKQPVA